MSNVTEASHSSLLAARSNLQDKHYGRAVANFLVYLKLMPEGAHEIYSEFALATKEWCEQLEYQNRLGDLFRLYDQACELYPDHDIVLNNFGAQLFRLGYIEEAAAYIRKSLLVNPNYLAARDNLESICSHLVERWHFSMLNDKRRNVAFKYAIDKAVKSGYNTVLDIGTGTGILSLVSDFCGAVKVTACDGSQAMVDVARDVLLSNGAFHSVKLLHKHSMDIKVPEDMASRVKLVVTETFDAGLFGEHIVSTMIHAWKNLLSTSPVGTVIPCGATMYVCGIECETIRSQTRFLYPVLQNLDMTKMEVLCSTGHVAEEPYTTENLAKIRGGYRILTNIAELLRVSFCNLYELQSIQKGKDWLCELYVKQAGRLDALAIWFDLHLDDSISIGTGADSNSCWEQAIFPLTNISRKTSHGCDSCRVRKREKLLTTFHFEQDCLRLLHCQLCNEPEGTRPSANKDKCKEQAKKPRTSGTSVKEYSIDCLPLRKRKVDSLTTDTVKFDSDITTKSDATCNNQLDQKASSSVEGKLFDKNECTTLACTLEEQQCEEGKLATPNKFEHLGLQCIGDEPSVSGAFSLRMCQSKGDGDDAGLVSVTQKLVCQSVTEVSGAQCDYSDGNNEKDNIDVEMHIEMEKCCLEKTLERVSRHEVDLPDGSGLSRLEVSGVLNENAVCPEDVKELSTGKLSCFVDQVDIEYINDIRLNKHYCQTLENFRAHNSEKYLSIFYMTPRLSFLGIQSIKMGYNMCTTATSVDHHNTIYQVAALNGCKQGDIILTELSDLNDVKMVVDVIVCDVVEPCGALRQQALEDLVYHKLTSLNTGGLIVPAEIKVHGLFIESTELEKTSHVTGDDVTLGFHIAEFINVFQMQNHMNIDMTTLTYSKLTDAQELLSVNIDGITIETSTNDLDQEVEKSLEVVSSGKVTALVYWFELKLNKDTTISTLDSRFHWKQAAIFIKDNVTVSARQRLVTKVKLQNSCLDVSIIKPSVNGHS